MGGLERAKREEGGEKGERGKGDSFASSFWGFLFFLEGGVWGWGEEYHVLYRFFLVSVEKEWGGIEFFFLGEEGDLLYICRTRRGGRELGF